MIKINYMSSLFVGIDLGSKSNVVCALNACLIAAFVRCVDLINANHGEVINF